MSLFLAAWPELEEFLEVEACPDLTYHPLPIAEPGARRVSRRPNGSRVSHGDVASPSVFQQIYWRAGAPARPLVENYLYPLRRVLKMCSDGFRLRKALTRHPVDLLHIINGGYPGAVSAQAAAIVAHGRSIPLMTVCSTAMDRPAFLQRLQGAVDRRVAAALSAFVVPGSRPGHALATKRGFPLERMVTIPWGVGAPAHRSTPARPDLAGRRPLRHELGLPTETPIVGMLSRMDDGKGQAVLIEAARQLRSGGREVHVAFAGDGPLRENLVALATQLGLVDRVTFLGHVPDRFRFLRAIDVFALPSDIEGLPYVVLEAMSQGVPVVASDVGAMPVAVVEGKTGFLVPPRDPAALAGAIGQVLDDHHLATRMSASAIEHFDEQFTLGAMVLKHERLYFDLVSAPG